MKDAMTTEGMIQAGKYTANKLHVHPDEFDDCVQEFCLGVLMAESRKKEGVAIRSYQWRYGSGYIYHYLRKLTRHQKRCNRMGREVLIDDAINYKADAIINEGMLNSMYDMHTKQLRIIINKLPEKLQTVVKLRYYHKMTGPEMAKEMNYTQQNISVLEKKAMNAITELYDKENILQRD